LTKTNSGRVLKVAVAFWFVGKEWGFGGEDEKRGEVLRKSG
jgi:hypothetical protein